MQNQPTVAVHPSHAREALVAMQQAHLDAERELEGCRASAAAREEIARRTWAAWNAWVDGGRRGERPIEPPKSLDALAAENEQLVAGAARRCLVAECSYLGARTLATQLQLLEEPRPATPLTRPEERRIFEALCTWLEVRTAAGRAWPADVARLRDEAGASARGGLLCWLLMGNEPLPEPPPLTMNQRPFHDVVATGRAEPFEVSEYEPAKAELGLRFFGVPVLDVDGHEWRLVKRLGESEWLIQPFQGGQTKRLGTGLWRVRCTGERPRLDASDGPLGQSWELVRESPTAGLDGSVPQVVEVAMGYPWEETPPLCFVARMDQVAAWQTGRRDREGRETPLELMSLHGADQDAEIRELARRLGKTRMVSISAGGVTTKAEVRSLTKAGPAFVVGARLHAEEP